MPTLAAIREQRRSARLVALRSGAAAVASNHSGAEVWLFGSLARGDAAPGSDADLLVILSSSAEHFLDRIPRYLLTGLSLGVDVFPYTRAEVEQMLAHGDLFLKQTMKGAIRLA